MLLNKEDGSLYWISLDRYRNLLTWHHQVLGDDTGLVSSHSTTQVLIVVEISALKVRVFGKKWQKTHAKPHANLTQKQQRTHDLT